MTARLATSDDNALLTSIVLHPDVHATNGRGAFDPSNYTAHPKNFAVIVEGGCFLADALERDAYAIHTNFLPEARGASALAECAEALRFAFTQSDAEVLYTRAESRHVALFAQAMGFKPTYKHGDMQFMRMDIDDWVLRDAQVEAEGEDFHLVLEANGHLTHGADPVHDRFVGAAVLMLRSVQYEKAERVYGRWARQAGYRPFAFISADPPRVDIGTCVLRLAPGSFTIEDQPCPQPQAQ